MATGQAQRPQFYEGQYLGADDLAALLAHAQFQRARHDLGAHTWGIAAGLELQEQEAPNGQIAVYVLPGFCWDGFGRRITILEPHPLSAELFKPYLYDAGTDGNNPPGRTIAVWLRYDETQSQPPRAGFEQCDADAAFGRVEERFRIEVGDFAPPDETQDRLAVGDYALYAEDAASLFVPNSTLKLYDESVAFQQLPNLGVRRRWLIPLGVVRWLPNNNAALPGSFVKRSDDDHALSRSKRRYIGVVAEAVQAAAGRIRLRDRTKPYSGVLSDDLVWAEGNVRVEGDLKLFGGKVDWRTQGGDTKAQGQANPVPLEMRRVYDAGNSQTMLQFAIGQTTTGANRFTVGPLQPGAGGAPPILKEEFVILDNGRVGVGTTQPGFRLDVIDRMRVRQGGAGSAGVWFFQTTPNEDRGFVGMRDDTQIGFWGRPLNTWGLVMNTANGNVGIGTLQPAFRLDVADRMRVRQGGGGSAGIWFFQTAPNADRGFVGMRDDNHIGFWGSPLNGWGMMMSTASGNVGIGVDQPALRLDVADRMRVRQGGSFSSGIWFWQTGPNNDRAFVGMRDDNHVGFWGNTGAGWGTVMNTANGNVGIGIAQPAYRLDVADRMRVHQGASGTAGIWFQQAGPNNERAFVGMRDDDHAGLWGNLGAGWGLLMNTATGNIGLGRLPLALADQTLAVQGNAFKPGGGNWGALSDGRLKKNVEPLANALDRLLRLRGVSFEWNEPETIGELGGSQMGFIAQEVEQVFPEWVDTETDDTKYLTIRGFEALAVEALRELSAANAKLSARVKKLEAQVKELLAQSK